MKFSQKQAFIMVGFPGSGKSTLAKKLAKQLGAQYVSSDVARKKLFNQESHDPGGEEVVNVVRPQVYDEITRLAIDHLTNKQKVIIDATNIEIIKREKLLAELCKAISREKMCYVIVDTPKSVISQRVRENSTTEATGGETPHQAWKRIYGYFEQRMVQGLVSWPRKNEGIDLINAKKINKLLAQEN